MRQDYRFEDIDKAVLKQALIALRVCPDCRRDMMKVRALKAADVYACDGGEYLGRSEPLDHDPIQYHIPRRVV
jgi:hypothetical protein